MLTNGENDARHDKTNARHLQIGDSKNKIRVVLNCQYMRLTPLKKQTFLKMVKQPAGMISYGLTLLSCRLE